MKGIVYQLKNIRRDKMSMLTFLLPVIVGLAIRLISGVSISALGENSFGIVKNNLASETVAWLQSNGRVSEFSDPDDLKSAVNDPASQMIGVLSDGTSIRTLLSGDELEINTVVANTLPRLYLEREVVSAAKIKILPAQNNSDVIKTLMIAITIVTAMFMGCTFNAMNMIGEKEDGITLINEVLPMTNTDFIIQKIFLGFIGGAVTAVLTVCVSMTVDAGQILPLLLIIMLSALIAALIGLFIGHFSNGLMAGIVYIKVVMILFLAPPIVFYLVVPTGSIAYTLSYLLPSSATFYGLMALLNGEKVGLNLVVLMAHCIVWLTLFLMVRNHNRVKR